MSDHVIIHYNEDLPEGYDSYSLLLIPDYDWLQKAGIKQSYKLFSRFKQFGDAIGPDHLAGWFYRGWLGSFSKLTDLEVLSAVYGLVGSDEEIRKFVVEKSDRVRIQGEREQKDFASRMTGGYDVVRAKYFCAFYGLNFNTGPYIAFFEEKPKVPLILRIKHTEYKISSWGRATKPSFVLRFDGMGFDRALAMFNELEYELLRAKPRIGRLRLHETGEHLASFCRRSGNKIGKALRFLKDVKEVVPLPSIKDVI